MTTVNTIVVRLARLDTCSVCDNHRVVRVELVNHNADGLVPCPLCRDASGLGAWLAPYLGGDAA